MILGNPMHVPEARRLVVRGRDDLRAISTEGGGPHDTFVAGEGRQRLAGGTVPEARRLVVRGRDDLRAIGTEGGGVHATFVAGEGRPWLAGAAVPTTGTHKTAQ